MMNPNLTLVVQIITMYNEGQERGATVSVCSHLKNTIEALSCFGAAFQPLVLEDLSKMDGNMNAEVYYYNSQSKSIWKVFDNGFIFQHDNDHKNKLPMQ